MNLPFPPLFAFFGPHVGPGTPIAVLVAIVGVVFGPRLAARLPWRRALWVGYLTAAIWTGSLALVDGWRRGWVSRLTTSDEYLAQLDRVRNPLGFLRGFSDHILDFQPGSWTTHISSHPPLATLVFWALDRVGLGGGGWAGLLVVLVGSAAGIAVAVTVAALGAPVAARRALPALVLFPGAVWVGVSADGLFTGVSAWGIALVALGVRRCRWWWAFTGGLMLGATLYLSYGLAALAFVVLAVGAICVRRLGVPIRRWTPVVVGLLMVVLVFTATGFHWWVGLRLLRDRYYQGIATDRPFGFFVWANFAALALCAGPMIAPGLVRAVPVALGWCRGRLGRSRAGSTGSTVLVPALLATAALTAVLCADLTGLSKAETERIWLPFAIWLLPCIALMPRAGARWALTAQVVVALAVNHLLLTNW